MKGKTVIERGVITTLCRQCDMRCGQEICIEGGRVTEIKGLETHPQNRGRICHKGRAAVDLVNHPDRLLNPLKRSPDGTFREISYDQAMTEIAEAMVKIKKQAAPAVIGRMERGSARFLPARRICSTFCPCLWVAKLFFKRFGMFQWPIHRLQGRPGILESLP